MTRATRLLQALFLSLPITVFAQFSDEFSDGDFLNNPTWSGDTGHFIVNGSFQLQSDGPAQSDTAQLHTAFTPDFDDTITWDLYWHLDFAPSGNNTSRIYLTSSSADLAGSSNYGYYIRIGNSGDDSLLLHRADGSGSDLIASGTTDYSNDPELSLRVVRYPSGLWEIYSDSAAGANYILETSVSDTTYTTCSRFGLWCKYTSSNNTNFYFDSIHVQATTFVDDEPPTLLSAVATNSTNLTLAFNEPLDNSTAQAASNYFVNNGVGTAQTATISNAESTEVTLTFASAFPLAQVSTISVSNVQDTAGNAIVNEQEDFTYFEFGTPSYRDVVINEIMADPSPVVGLPESEFVEIFNAGSDFYNLTGAQFSDASGTATVAGAASIAPGEYVILCRESDTADFSGFGKTVGMSSFPSLNNDGDDLTLTISGTVVDVLSYTDAWYNEENKTDGGYTLEQRNPTTPCNGIGNWAASDDLSGGTPGAQNSVFDTLPEMTAPEVLDLTTVSSTELNIDFNETMDSTSLVNATYSIQPSLGSVSVSVSSPGFSSASLTLPSAMDSAVLYTLIISGATDCIGNALPTDTLRFGLGSAPNAFDLIINELYIQPDEAAGIPAVEFVEIHNRSGKLLRVEGVALGDRSSFSTISTLIMEDGEYVIVCDNDDVGEFDSSVRVASVSSMPSLNNSDDDIALMKGLTTIDQVSYKSSWFGDDDKADGGFTLERIDPNNLCGLSENWIASIAPEGGTPGAENSVFETTGAALTPSLLAAQFKSLNEVVLVFDRSMDTTSLFGANISAGTETLTAKEMSADRASLTATAPTTFTRGNLYRLSIDSAKDCAGHVLPATSYDLYLHAPGDVIINEVLFNPRESGSDFVELYNTSDFTINLQGWTMGYFDSDDSLRYSIISEEPRLLSPGGYIALNEDNDDILLNYPNAPAENLFETNLPSYANDQGSVMTYDQFELRLDRFDYEEDMHFALIDDYNGVSLERLDADRASDDDGNWHSASSEDNYATPGYLNSQHYPSAVATAAFSLSSEYISPDNDGYQDVVNIEYQVPGTETSVTVKVYNDRGILVREVVTNQLIGNKGSITWDGTNDKGEKVRTGIHVILVETFGLSGNKTRYRLPVVVATKL